jgi:hypothetical protein
VRRVCAYQRRLVASEIAANGHAGVSPGSLAGLGH